MTAALAWNGVEFTAPVGTGRQRRLTVVPMPSDPAPAVRPGVRSARAAAPVIARRRIALAADRRIGGVHVTRAGRLALTGFAASVLAVATYLATSGLGGASAAVPQHTITVRSGQTLSELAVTYLPDLTIAEGIKAIQQANRLQNDRIIAGDPLVIPEP
ncbi:MAG: LysM peptidoglycan-binding domain-containing protein [Dermatophilaceae bacterium]